MRTCPEQSQLGRGRAGCSQTQTGPGLFPEVPSRPPCRGLESCETPRLRSGCYVCSMRQNEVTSQGFPGSRISELSLDPSSPAFTRHRHGQVLSDGWGFLSVCTHPPKSPPAPLCGPLLPVSPVAVGCGSGGCGLSISVSCIASLQGREEGEMAGELSGAHSG